MKISMLRHILHIACLLLVAGAAHAGEAGRIVLVAGDVQMGGQRVVADSVVREGDELVTGRDGYAYLKTVDSGFLILRPNTRVRVVAYSIDAQDPANTHIKFELLNGVARSISGGAVKQARQNFRFNTPVAAIGVRGTDFTVFTDQQTTRIAVISGGVVASGFSAACAPEGGGPCEGPASRELFAGQADKLLQINRDQAVPQLLRGNGLSPDSSAPPRSDEPGANAADASAGKSTLAVNDINLDPQKGAIQLNVTPPIPPIPSRQLIWGRWQSLLGQPANIDIAGLFDAQGQLVAINSHFAILRSSGADWQMPARGVMGFALAQGDAYILNESSGLLASAGMENARLQLDFAKSTFATGFDLVSQQNERFKFQSQGSVLRDGRLIGDSQFASPTNMAVGGAVDPASGNAAYLFQGRIDNQRLAGGMAVWTKN
jgi:hypothetical protein